jgi:ankyrin repeat protein
MSDLRLNDGRADDDVTTVKELPDNSERLIEAGADINQPNEHGWTLLSVSAAKGDAKLVSQLLEKGADVFKTGLDQRTPYMIALAAGHIDIAKSLKEEMERHKSEYCNANERPYCRAYPLKQLREFAGWNESGLKRDQNESVGNSADQQQKFSDTDVVFLHQDLSVTASMWHGANIIFDQVTPAWTEFASSRLQFSVPQITDHLT